MGATGVPLSDVLCANRSSAELALEAAGCTVEPELEMAVEHPMLGTIHRLFGVVGNLVSEDDTEERRAGEVIGAYGHVDAELSQAVLDNSQRLLERMVRLLDAPDNERTFQRLVDGQLKYMPSNKRIAATLRERIGDGGAHLPWGLTPLNLDLSMKVQRHCKGYGFVVFYSQDAKLPVGSPPSVRLGRVFSTPFGVTGFGTWQEPISTEILDEDVGLVLEASFVG